MKVLMAASEAAPFAKTGGLADVLGSLPSALVSEGVQTAVVLPMYKPVAADRVYERMRVLDRAVDIRRTDRHGVAFFFVEEPGLFERPALYGEGGVDYPDNHVRFNVYCRAVLGVVRYLFRPDVVHCHDWQAGLVPPLMRHTFRTDPTFAGIPSLMTIHNIGYQGLFPPETLPEMGLDRMLMQPGTGEFWGRFSFLKAGLVYADAISTVSKAYAREIQTAEFGFGLEGLLQSRADVLSGILNGVDYSEWSPEADAHIAASYSVDELSGKQECKRDLLEVMGLPPENLHRPVIGIVSRFVGQKGFDLIAEVADRLMSENVCLAAIGTGQPEYEAAMLDLAARYPDRAAVRIAYDNEIAHKIEAGADIFLMPSHYEPCGLNQIYSLRYGTVPVVRATGGLDDTIDEKTGFKFGEYSGQALLDAIGRALAAWHDRKQWVAMMREGMRRDYSWRASANEYAALYRKMIRGAAAA